MKQFEYIVERDCDITVCNEMGEEGWELCGVVPLGIFYFKREKVEVKKKEVKEGYMPQLPRILCTHYYKPIFKASVVTPFAVEINKVTYYSSYINKACEECNEREVTRLEIQAKELSISKATDELYKKGVIKKL